MSCNCNNSCFQNNACCQNSCCHNCSSMNGNCWNNMNWQSGCGCSISRPNPIVAPKKVCTTFQNQCVEQPVICPIECRRINNVVYVPRYYPQYEHTCFTQSNNNWNM